MNKTPTRLVVALAGCIGLILTIPAPGQMVYEPYAITTLTGMAGANGSTDGSTGAARFYYPYGIALDSAGNIYVADEFNCTIRKISTGGVVGTLAGLAGSPGSSNGTGSNARFSYPQAVSVDGANNVYVADTNNHTIRKVTPSGVVTTMAGAAGLSGSADGLGSSARFYSPNALAADSSGNVFVADTYNHTIRKITPSGMVSTFAGQAGQAGTGNGSGTAARFQYPFGLAVSAAGDLYVADSYNYTIRKITSAGLVSTLAGSPGAIGSADGTGSAAHFYAPRGVAVDGSGNIYVADEYNDTLRKITPAGAVTTLAGAVGVTGSSDGLGSSAQFNRAAAIAVNPSGKLYIGDTQNSTIRIGIRAETPPSQLKDGKLDTNFDAGKFTNGLVTKSLILPDGKLVIGGNFSTVHGVNRHNLARLNVDGSLDLSFDAGDGPDYGLSSMVLQSDGKLILAGGFSRFDGVDHFSALARVNQDGSLDDSFQAGRSISYGGQSDESGAATNPGYIGNVALQPDGKVVVAGSFDYIVGPGMSTPRSCVARFNTDGTFDPTYDPGTGFAVSGVSLGDLPYINFVVAQTVGPNSGKVILQGYFDSFNGHAALTYVRLNTDGSFDDTFTAPESGDNSQNVYGLYVQNDDKIVAFGMSSLLVAVAQPIIRLQADGAIDQSFSPSTFAAYDTSAAIYTVAQQGDGKLMVGGFFHSVAGVPANNAVRLNEDGTRDGTFNSTIAAGPSGFEIMTISVRPENGEAFLGGYFSTYGGVTRRNLAWTASDGTLLPAFDELPGAADYAPQVYALATQPDGKILVGGFFSSFNGTPHYNLVRLNADATIDPAFNPAFATEGSIRAIDLLPDGKIVIGGNIRAVNGVARGRVARLQADGTLDASFNSGMGADGTVYALAHDSSGNIYAGGSFSLFNGTSRKRLAKLSVAGVLDTNFDPGSGPNANINAITVTNLPNIIIGGSFTTFNGTNVGRIARLNATTASVDSSFNNGASGFSGIVQALKLGPEGKIYVGGFFTTYNGVQRSRLARLLPEGALDNTFVPPSNALSVSAIALQGTKLLAGGTYSSGMAPLRRLISTGGLDSTFEGGTGAAFSPPNVYYPAGPAISALAVQADGSPLVGGIFNQYNGTPRVCLARLTSPAAPAAQVTSVTRLDDTRIFLQGFGSANTTYHLQDSPDLGPDSFHTFVDVTTDGTGYWQYQSGTLGLTRQFFRLTSP